MKKNQIAIVILVVMLLGGIGFYFATKGESIESQVGHIAEDAIMAISDGWDTEELKTWSDPGLIKAMGSQGQSAEQLMRIYSALGQLKEKPECGLHSSGSFMKNRERHKTISYNCAAKYEKGPAKIALTLSKADSADEWHIYYINFHSDVFVNGQEQEGTQ